MNTMRGWDDEKAVVRRYEKVYPGKDVRYLVTVANRYRWVTDQIFCRIEAGLREDEVLGRLHGLEKRLEILNQKVIRKLGGQLSGSDCNSSKTPYKGSYADYI